MYQSIQLYFFTGTGNTYRAASWLAEIAQSRDIQAKLTPIDGACPGEDLAGSGQLVGLLCPTHAFSAPWSMLIFALRLPRGRGEDAFVMLTRGGMKFGSLYAPGLEGSGAYLLALILRLKGYRVRGAGGVDMPAVWTALLPGYSKPSAEAILERGKPQALNMFERILSGQTAFRGLVPLLFGLILLPLTLAYLVMGRFFLAKLFYAAPSCNGCGLCAQICPARAIRMRGQVKPRPYWTLLCESCSRCINFCPNQAVEASYPFAALLVYLASLPLLALLLDWIGETLVQAAGWKGTLVEQILSYPFHLLVIVLAYALFSLLIRVPQVNRLLTLLTPTHYYRRYHEPATRLSEIRRR